MRTDNTFVRIGLCVTVLIISFFSGPLQADDSAVLTSYIMEGLRNNLELAQQKINLQNAYASIKEAKSRFFPTVSFQARYTLSSGGRTIDLPVGSLLNPVYRNLDLINQGSLPPYPTIEDVSVGLLPQNDQETKIQVIQPLFAPSIPVNYRLQTHLKESVAAKVETAERSLIRDLRIAYYTCLQAKDAITVYNASLQRVSHLLRTAEKLSRAGMLNNSGLLSVQADVSSAEAKYQQSLLDFKNAKRAFNLLLNRDIESEPELSNPDSLSLRFIFQRDLKSTSVFESQAQSRRSELKTIRESIAASEALTQIEKFSMLPTIGASVEGGLAGDKYDLSKKGEFITGSVLLQWKLFSGTERLQKVNKARLSENQLKKLYDETISGITFQVRKICEDLFQAKIMCTVADKQLQAAEKNYETVLKRYEAGDVPSTDMTDASTLLTNANVNLSMSRYSLIIKDAELRFATADDTLENYHTQKRENSDDTVN